jgi:hypothetical protein
VFVYIRVLFFLLGKMRSYKPLYAANIVGHAKDGKWICPYPWLLKFLSGEADCKASGGFPCDLQGMQAVYTVNGGGE